MLYKMVKKSKLNELKRKGFLTFNHITSFTDELSSRHAEFGTVLLKVKKAPICGRYNCVKVHYTLDWFKKHPDLYEWVTWESLIDDIKFIKATIKKYGHYENEIKLSKAFEKMLYYKDYVRENEIVAKSKNSKPIKIYANEISNIKEYEQDFW